MALADITIDFDLAQILGSDFDPRRTKAYVTTNVESGTLMDTSTGETRLGDEAVTVASDGTGSFTTWATGADGNPTSWQTSLVVDYPRTGQRDRKRRVFGPWTLTTADDGKNITELATQQEIPAEYVTQVTDELQTYSDAAASSASAAATSATEAAASAALADSYIVADLNTSDGQMEALIESPTSLTSAALSATIVADRSSRANHAPAFGLYFPEAEGGVGDGVTDDGAALQAVADACPSGGTVWIEKDFLTTTKTVITTPNQRWASPSRDQYSGVVRSATASLTMFEVKTYGFIWESNLVGDGTDRGENATITGLDFYGTTAGDIDAHVAKGSFVYLACGVRARSRNVRVIDNLFSNCLNGFTSQGKDGAYHTAAADVVRGIIVKDNRFHSMGFTAADASVLFTGHADFRHGEVKDNYFDMVGNGRGVVAVGTALAPLKSLTMAGDKHQDIRAAAYDLTYCTDFVLAPDIINGDSGGLYEYDGIVLTSCTIGSVVTPLIRRTGRSGIKGTGNSQIRVLEPVIQGCGIHAASTGHGLDFDSTNSQMRFVNPTVQGVDGYGFTGDPTDSRLEGGEFRTCTLGRINSTTLRGADRFKAGSDFVTTSGTPTTSSVNGYACLMYDAAGTEMASAVMEVPSDWVTFNIEVWWLNPIDAAGDVRFQVGYSTIADGSQLGLGTVAASTQSVVTGATNRVHKFTAHSSIAAPFSGEVGIRVQRLGSDAADTYATDIGLVGVRLVRAI